MPYRIAWLRDKPAPYNKAWVRSIRRDGTFRYTSAPRIAKTWLRPGAPERAVAKRLQLADTTPGLEKIDLRVEFFNDPNEVNPFVVPVDEFVEHGLI